MAKEQGDSWRPLVAQALTAREIDTLLAREVPYVHVPDFLSPAWCEEIVGRFSAAVAALPDHCAQHMGPALFDTLVRPIEMFVDSSNPDEYFDLAAIDAPRVRALFAGGPDPLAMMRAAWSGAGWSEVVAAEGARRYLVDAVWGLEKAAAPPHIDAYERDRQSALSRFGRHINYNVYLQNADAGGAFAVYRRYADEDPGAVGPTVLEPAALAGVERFEHRPAPGDLVIFDAMLYHEVLQVDGARHRRVQVHSNLLVDTGQREFTFYV